MVVTRPQPTLNFIFKGLQLALGLHVAL